MRNFQDFCVDVLYRPDCIINHHSFIWVTIEWKKEEKYEGPKSTNVFPIQPLNEHAEHLERAHRHTSAAPSHHEVRLVFENSYVSQKLL